MTVKISKWYINPKYVEYINLSPIGGTYNDELLQGVRISFTSGHSIFIPDSDAMEEYKMSAQEFVKKFLVNKDRY